MIFRSPVVLVLQKHNNDLQKPKAQKGSFLWLQFLLPQQHNLQKTSWICLWKRWNKKTQLLKKDFFFHGVNRYVLPIYCLFWRYEFTIHTHQLVNSKFRWNCPFFRSERQCSIFLSIDIHPWKTMVVRILACGDETKWCMRKCKKLKLLSIIYHHQTVMDFN